MPQAPPADTPERPPIAGMPATGVLCALDASANRAREALRTAEDTARFCLHDSGLTARCKQLRHALRSAMDSIPCDALQRTAHRDTAHDPGTALQTDSEYRRSGARAVAAAACKRLTEALRSVEEFAKAVPGGVPAARKAEALRYKAYDLERDLLGAFGAGRDTGWRLCVLLTGSLCPAGDWEAVAQLAAGAGADCLQLREKDLPDAELLRRATRLVQIAAPHGCDVVVNDRVDIALLCGAQGVHLGASDLAVRDARRLAGSSLRIGATTPTLDAAVRATCAGADACGVGAVFPTKTKPGASPEGAAQLTACLASDQRVSPCLAIGGVTPENAQGLVERLAPHGRPFGIAVSAGVCGAADPAAATAALRAAIDPVWQPSAPGTASGA